MDATADGPIGTGGHSLRGWLLLLRGRSGLAQHALAALLGISDRAIQKWEAGESYPSATRLQTLIALYLERGLLAAGQEEAEARALWAALQHEAGQRVPPFDPAWFASLLAAAPAAAPPDASAAALSTAAPAGAPPPAGTTPSTGAGGQGGRGAAVAPGSAAALLAQVAAATEQPAPVAGPRWDWGEAPAVDAFQGRAAERDTLRHWLVDEHCRVVALLGLGGIGKTTLATCLAQEVAPHYAGLCWRSVRNAPPPAEWLGAAIAALAPAPPVLPPGLPARLALLLALLRERRCLLVLDNLETVLEPGERTARYGAGYEGYGEVLRQVGESSHQSALLLTTREAPPELALLTGQTGPVRIQRLEPLDLAASRALLADKGLAGEEAAWGALVGRYGGNPLALKVVAQSIAELFGGEIAAFLDYTTEPSGAVFGGVRQVLEEQVARLSPLEQSVLYWLAVAREPVGVARLTADLGPGAGRGSAVLDALAGLRRRSLLERGAQGGTHTLQPVVLEYVTGRLVAAVGQEIVAGAPALLVSHALVQAQARDYARQSQERLIAQPLLEHLRTTSHSAGAAERRLLELLDGWRDRPAPEQGYGPGNVVNLLRLLRGDLRGLDLSGLSIRQAYLAQVEMQDASLVGAHLTQAVLAEAFNIPGRVALSANGAYLAAGTSTGQVCLWRVADRTPLLDVPGHSGFIEGMALSADGQLLASAGSDGTVRLWDVENGRALATLHGHAGEVWAVALSGDGRLLASGGLDGTVRLWEVSSGACRHMLQAERRYARLDITGLSGVTEAQRAALLALGAVEHRA